LVVTGQQPVGHVRGRRERVELPRYDGFLAAAPWRSGRELADGVTEDLGDDGDHAPAMSLTGSGARASRFPKRLSPATMPRVSASGVPSLGVPARISERTVRGVATALRQLRHQPAAVGDDVDHEWAGAGLGDEAQQVALARGATETVWWS
jgi:hypothetical protein